MENSKLGELMTAWRAAREEVKATAAQLGFRLAGDRIRRTPLVRMGCERDDYCSLPPTIQARIRCAEILDCFLNDQDGLADDLASLDELLEELRQVAPTTTMSVIPICETSEGGSFEDVSKNAGNHHDRGSWRLPEGKAENCRKLDQVSEIYRR
jgi:hypothetical protein